MDFFVRTESGQFVPVAEGYKDTGTQNPNATYAFGNGGLFNTPGLNPGIINAMILPELGLQAALPVTFTNQMQPLTPLFTGVTASTGSFSAAPCGDTKQVGLAKLCNITTKFGRMSLKTPTIDLTRVGQFTNRGYFSDFRLIGDPMNSTITNGATPTLPNGGISQAITSEVQKQMMQFRIGWAREFAKLIYAGNPVNNLGDGYKEFNGLDLLINTGYQDAETGVWCPAANSLLQSFSSQNFSTSGTAATNLVGLIQDMHRALVSIADRTGLSPVSFKIAMARDMFYELTKVWPIAYATTATTVIAGAQTNTQLQVNSMDAAQMRDSLRTGRFLMINGIQVPVVLDDAIAQTAIGGNVFESTIYFIPVTVLGNTPATYTEYFNFDGDGALQQASQVFGITGKYFTTDAGRYAFVRQNDNFCVSFLGVEMTRIRMDTPFLAARLTSVRYTAGLPTRSGFPGDATFYNGGKTSTVSAPSLYPPNVYSA